MSLTLYVGHDTASFIYQYGKPMLVAGLLCTSIIPVLGLKVAAYTYGVSLVSTWLK